ncbi:MAG: lysophospholipid acyltransferase family protein [Polyangiaceae bacterium]
MESLPPHHLRHRARRRGRRRFPRSGRRGRTLGRREPQVGHRRRRPAPHLRRADVEPGRPGGLALVGAAARSVGTVFVDRANVQSGMGAIRGIEALLRTGDTVHVFAEGTTFADDEVRPFHPGTFVAARSASASIQPVGLAYRTGSGAQFVGETFPAHLSRMAGSTSGRVALVVGTPFAASSAPNARALRDRTHDAVSAAVARARVIVDAAPS